MSKSQLYFGYGNFGFSLVGGLRGGGMGWRLRWERALKVSLHLGHYGIDRNLFSHVHIWQESVLLSCGDICQIWMWCWRGKQCFHYHEKMAQIGLITNHLPWFSRFWEFHQQQIRKVNKSHNAFGKYPIMHHFVTESAPSQHYMLIIT